ncbi:hypothetical protein M409DRAFT_23415 [Zasmidium cellare ATCC 36951]|uniref:Conserved oligomeric Golgi complex subunit 5 n=1 Tax=Zasmidium cellare ATCC 36951 TaxID=1080233 RepID=A0A6A6CHY1_ZASCE|nr:uncharacterized protein M409DRAFT_23415 [Zasmidium cellare ATCC 36951]KAF2166223.1 hypothetical protein M409DRAFT_23415 [Zasmidium cellare ATCC 36951]
MADTSTSSYLDTKTFLSPTFSPSIYANSLILQTNNASDTPLDLSTPLSRVLFDVQEVDTKIDTLTTQNAPRIISHAQNETESGKRVLEVVEEQVKVLNESYERLEREVGERYEAAEQVRLVAERMVRTLRLGRQVQRVVQLGRQLEGQMEEVSSPPSARQGSGARAMVPASRTLLELRGCFAEGSAELGRCQAAVVVRQDLVTPSERGLVSRAQGVVREFSLSGVGGGGASGEKTFAQAEETKARAASAMQTLYLLSPVKRDATLEAFEPTLLVQALQSYLQTALTSSLAALSRALATLPTLERTLLEISARCQNITALENLLETIKPPAHPLLPPSDSSTTTDDNFLQPLLRHLDTSSLPSYFWRSMAGQMTARVQEILQKGGVSARTLRSNRDRVRDSVRECVDRGYRGAKKQGNWEREAAVMVGSVVGPLGR